MQKRLPYSRRVAISIMYRVPVDGTMSPQHLHYIAPPPVPDPAGVGGATPPGPQGPPPSAPALTGQLQIGQQTMTPSERRAGV